MNDTHAWLEINNTIIDITHGQFGAPPDVYIGNYSTSNTYLGYKVTTRRLVSQTDYGLNAYYLNEAYSIINNNHLSPHAPVSVIFFLSHISFQILNPEPAVIY